ncbi:Phophatidylserine decarboxylase-domain-containing protein [Cyathus striatus]|nr:Phophatidylserine decarboxylase-domain-containing protein [Cyathus striatus]
MPYNQPFHPIIQEFQQLIENDPVIREAMEEMFMVIPTKPPYNLDPTGRPQIRNYNAMLSAFNHNLTQAPAFYGTENGMPFDSILYWPRQTKSGQEVFSDDQINKVFKRMFDVWAKLLTSHGSCHVLTTEKHGWFGPMGRAKMPHFTKMYECDPYAPYYGFKSWDDFFTRRFRPGQRPVVDANDSSVINNACESTVYRIAYNVKERDMFWVKGSPRRSPGTLVPLFAGGTVFQSYLSTTQYHRWHCPVNGVVHKIVTLPGTYITSSPWDGHTGGMVEVSTCEATVRVCQKVKKGQETGMFHFGGSTHCLIFRPQTKISFSPKCRVDEKINVNDAIATVT